MATTTAVPVRDDSLLTDIFQEWAIRTSRSRDAGLLLQRPRVVVVGGTTRERTVAVLREFTDNIIFDEAGHDFVLPGQAKSNPVTATTAEIGEFAWRHVPGIIKDQIAGPVGWVSGKVAHVAAADADVIIGSFSELMRFGLPDLAGKAIITSTVSEDRLATLSGLGADLVVDVTPQPFDFMVVPAMYEAIVAATLPGGSRAHDRRPRPIPPGRRTRTPTAVAAWPHDARAVSRSSSTRCRPSTSRTSSRSGSSRASPA